MQMDFGTVTPTANTIQKGYDSVKPEVKSDNVAVKDVSAVEKLSITGEVKAPKDEDGEHGKGGKMPTEKSIEAAFDELNAKMKEQKTRCEYSYDEDTKRISISVYDKDSDELIREIPPEESLEVLHKVWELAGIVVDEKR